MSADGGAAILQSPAAPETAPSPGMNPRTQLLLHGPIVATLLRLAWPNILVMLVQASTGLIETWWVSHLGTAALTGMAVVFPGFMMMQMLSAGAIGGGIASAIARALGGGRHDDADALVLHALAVNAALGTVFAALAIAFGRPLYAALGAEGESLEAALLYSDIVFAGTPLMWIANALASVIRGTGAMFMPSLATIVGVALLIPLSPLLIFGFGPLPALGIAGAGFAVVTTLAITAAMLGWHLLAGRCVVRLRRARLRAALFADILGVGAIAAISALQTSLILALTTALVGTAAGPDAVAGYGTASRLEFLLIPLVFGLGAPLVALVGTNVGAGRRERALRIALIGGAIAFALTETIGIAAALWPEAWLRLFSDDPLLIATGSAYFSRVGPAYGFFGLGLALYFASQGAGRVLWPLLANLLRLAIAVGGGWLVLRTTGSLDWTFAMLATGMTVYGVAVTAAIVSGVWFREVAR